MTEMAIPQRMKFQFKELDNIRKENYSWVPSSGQTVVQAGQYIIIDLPVNSLVDLSTFQMRYRGRTSHNGNVNAAACNRSLQTRFFPRNSASIIQNCEIKINNVTIFNVPDYNLVWNKLYDYSQSGDGLNRRKIGENGDPSSKTYISGGNVYSRRGYAYADSNIDALTYDQDYYVIKSWLGPFASASTQIIDTSLLGTVSIKLTLAPASILMLGAASTGALDAVAANDSETGRQITALVPRDNSHGGAGGSGNTAAQIANYTIEEIQLSIDRYVMTPEFYEAQAKILSSGSVYRLFFPNYTVLSSNPVSCSNKSGVHRFSLSTRSLDWVMGTFKLNNFDVIGPVLNSKLSGNDGGFYGDNNATFESQCKNCLPRLFNNTRYLACNGESITSTKWKIGTHEYRLQTIQESFDGLCNHFNITNDCSGGFYPGIQSLNHFIETFYCDLISLNVSGEPNDIFTISGINTQQGPINIEWYVNGSQLAGATDLTPNGANDKCLPYLIAGHTSHIAIRAGRQIELIS